MSRRNKKQMSNVENTIWTSLIHKRWLRSVIAMASVVVFVTVYSLILPAAALTEDEARQTPGIELGTSEAEGGETIVADGEYIEEIPVDDPNYTAPAAEEATEEPAAEPAAEETPAETAEPQAAEGENPEALTATDDGTAAENSEADTTEAPATDEVNETQTDEAAAEGTQTEPAADTSNNEESTEQTQTAEDAAASEQPAADAAVDNTKAQTEEAGTAEETEAEENTEEETAPETPAEVTYSAGTLAASAGAANVTVTYDESAQIADGASLVLSTVDRTVKTSRLYETVFSQFTSISIADADGNEIVPAEGSSVSVSVEYSELPDGTRTDYAVIDGENKAVESFNVSLPATIGTVVTVEKTFAAGSVSYEGDGYQITLKYGENAKLPENCTLQVSAVEKEVEVDENVYEVLASKFMALSLVDADGNNIVPANDAIVNAEVTFNDISEDAIRTNYVIADAELKTVDAFDITLPGTIGVVYTAEKKIYEDGTLAFEGEDFKVVLAYNKDSGIPKGSKLDVTEIKEDTKSSDGIGYDEYRAKAEEELDKKDRAVKNARFFDIKILDKKGNEIEPTGDVKVSISQKKADPQPETETKKEDVQKTVVHFTEEETKEIEKVTEETVEEIATGLQAIGEKVGFSKKTDEEEKDNYTFETDSFSVYGIIETDTITVDFLTATGKNLKVSVSSTDEYDLPRFSDVEITEFAPESAEYQDAYAKVVEKKKAEDENFNEDNFGFTALDITLYDKEGNAFEPDGLVNVKIEVVDLPAENDVLVDTMEVQHLAVKEDGSVEVQTVATSADVEEVEGVVTAAFDVDGFSTFTLTWNDGNNKATIHFGKMNGTEFEEFEEETINFDTSATSINIANTFSGYTYQGAVYCTDGQSIEDGVDMDSIINKTSNGWQITQYTTNDNDETVPSQINIANGSDIYAVYYVPQSDNPSGADDEKIPSPTTTKTVTNNGDGTYTIQLDITGATVTEDNSHYANILVILDATRSMRGAKWTNAKTAMRTLVETLCEGANAANAGKIDFALVTFGRSATVTQNWTKDNAAFKTTCANLNMVSTSGTNWEAGMRGGLYGVLNNMPDDDPTFVIFLTDGDPNVYYESGAATNYSDTGTTSGWNQNANTSATHSADEAKAIAAKTQLYGIYCGDSGTTPSGDSYNRLVSVITGSGQGGVKTIAANADTIESEFKAIAETALKSIGANNVSVDDGVPSLSSVSAQTVGEAGAFEYFIKGENDSDFSTWTDAPGASYSNDNGVTWDLSKVGTLPEKTTYRLKFTVWPSQEAYDTIADLNNGIKTMEADELDALGIENVEGVYTLKTNTHLKTTYTFKNEHYTDSPDELAQGHMLLPTETIKIKKVWNNPYDPQVHDPGAEVELYVTKDGSLYLSGDKAVKVTAENNWVSAKDIYISCGLISKHEGNYVIEEVGHDYSIAEPAEYSYLWDLTCPVYHPMVINGTETVILILDDNATGTDGTDYYVIKGSDGKKHKYRVASESESTLTATNDRRSYLDVIKEIDDLSDDQGADADSLFEYTCTVGKTGDEDIYFSAYSGGFLELEGTNITKEMKNGEWTGYYYTTAGSTFTFKVKAGWSIRFINLPVGTEYTIQETSMDNGFSFEKADGEAWSYQTGQEEDYAPTADVSAATVTGSIDASNHSYKVTITNKYEPSGVELTVKKVWDTGTPAFVTTHGPITVALFKDANGDGVIAADEYISGTERTLQAGTESVKYDKLSSLGGIVVREVTVSTETSGEGDAAVTTKTVTPIDPSGKISVSGETTTAGSDATNTYKVTYAPGTAADNKRTDEITNTLITTPVELTKIGDWTVDTTLGGVQFKVYSDAECTKQLTVDSVGNAIGANGLITTGTDGKAAIGTFIQGTYYLQEVKTAAGYNMLSEAVAFTVNADGTVTYSTGNSNFDVTPGATYQTDNGGIGIYISNPSGTVLPNTGGPGTLIYTLSGLILLTGSVIGLSMRRRERRLN